MTRSSRLGFGILGSDSFLGVNALRRDAHIMKEEMVKSYYHALAVDEEKSESTARQYANYLGRFYNYLGSEKLVEKRIVLAFKKMFLTNHTAKSTNCMVSALNGFFHLVGWEDCVIKQEHVQESAFREGNLCLSIKEYQRLVKTAEKLGKRRLSLIMQTICSTGIRVSELKYINVESLKGRMSKVRNKGKVRMIIIPEKMCKLLREYANEKGIEKGPIFITRNGKPIDRSNILHDMKKLGKKARVHTDKIFPHNLRHLFAVTFYKLEKDIFRLADLLGHASVNTTRIYTNISVKEEEVKLAKMGLVITD